MDIMPNHLLICYIKFKRKATIVIVISPSTYGISTYIYSPLSHTTLRRLKYFSYTFLRGAIILLSNLINNVIDYLILALLELCDTSNNTTGGTATDAKSTSNIYIVSSSKIVGR